MPLAFAIIDGRRHRYVPYADIYADTRHTPLPLIRRFRAATRYSCQRHATPLADAPKRRHCCCFALMPAVSSFAALIFRHYVIILRYAAVCLRYCRHVTRSFVTEALCTIRCQDCHAAAMLIRYYAADDISRYAALDTISRLRHYAYVMSCLF